MAFIPQALGVPFHDTPPGSQTGFANQAAFDAEVASVGGTWAKEPGQFGRDTRSNYFATDDRGFGGGSHRIRASLGLDAAQIGQLAGGSTGFQADSNASHQAYVDVAGWTEQEAHVHQTSKTATASGTSTAIDVDANTSVITHQTAGSYPFSMMAPNIDLSGAWTFHRNPSGGVEIEGSGEHNEFPFYEILVNGASIYSFSSADTGPGLMNLNSGHAWTAKVAV